MSKKIVLHKPAAAAAAAAAVATGAKYLAIMADPPWAFRDQGTRLAPGYEGRQRAGRGLCAGPAAGRAGAEARAVRTRRGGPRVADLGGLRRPAFGPSRGCSLLLIGSVVSRSEKESSG